MPNQPDLTAVSEFIAATSKVLSEPVDAFALILDRLGDEGALLVAAGDLLLGASYPGCAARCFEKAVTINPEDHLCRAKLAISLLGIRRIKEAMNILTEQVARGVIVYSVFDQVCNEALWLGLHDLVVEFIATNSIVLASAAQSDPDGYFADAILSYACECDQVLFAALCGLYERSAGKPYRYVDQSYLPGSPEVNDFFFASHGFAGTNAIINFLLLIGVRVDEISRRWAKGYQLDDLTEIRTYCQPPADELAARLLRRYFPLQRNVRCYSFAHRLPNPRTASGRRGLFLIRDPRVSLTTWVKPRSRQVESGTFAHFATIHAQDWCDFIDGMERIENRIVVRFEDWQADPYRVAETVIDHFGLKVRRSELEEAIFFSGTEFSRQLRAINREIHGFAEPQPENPDDPKATPEMLRQEYALIENICAERMDRYRYEVPT